MNLTTLLSALENMTQRKPEALSATTVRAAFTTHRYLELSNEADDAVSAWAVGSLLVAGKPVRFAVLIGRLFEPARLRQTMGKAKVLIQEVIGSGRNAATALGEGVGADGTRVILYHASDFDPATAKRWLTSYAARNRTELVGDEVEKTPAAKVAKKSKLFDAAAAST